MGIRLFGWKRLYTQARRDIALRTDGLNRLLIVNVRLATALEEEAASHDLLAPLNPLLTQYHREHAAKLRAALEPPQPGSQEQES